SSTRRRASRLARRREWSARACSRPLRGRRSTASVARGGWTPQTKGNVMSEYAVVNPATGETVARYDSFTDAQVEQTLRRAAAAFETWRKLLVADRARIVRRAADLHRERRKELAAIIVREMGKPFAAAGGEVDVAADVDECS